MLETKMVACGEYIHCEEDKKNRFSISESIDRLKNNTKNQNEKIEVKKHRFFCY